MLENKNLIIKKHSAMIQTSVGNLTLTQRKAINFLIYIVQKSGINNIYKTTISNIKSACNLASTENIAVKEQLKALTKTTIEFNYLDKDQKNIWEISTLLAGCRIFPSSGIIEFAFSPFLLDRILYPEMYAPLNLILISGLKCSYAVTLYEFLRDYLTSPSVPMLTIEDCKNLLGVNETKYKAFPDFKRNVLKPAEEEVNLKTDICCRYELIKEKGIRNKYSHIRFFVSKKTGNFTYERNKDIKKTEPYISMDLFENKVATDNKIAVQIPGEIISVIPDNQRTEVVKDLITRFLEKGNEFVISNVKYSLKKSKDNFPAYLKMALEKDYAEHDREVEKTKKAAEQEARKKKAELERNQKEKSNEAYEMMDLVKSLPEDIIEKLREKAIEEIKENSPKNSFALRETIILLKMGELYLKEHKMENYSNKDVDLKNGLHIRRFKAGVKTR